MPSFSGLGRILVSCLLANPSYDGELVLLEGLSIGFLISTDFLVFPGFPESCVDFQD
jgi:hypothetical protein